MYSSIVEFYVLYIIIRSILLIVLCKYTGYLLIFSLLSIIERGVLESLILIIDLSGSYSFVDFCFIYVFIYF